MPRNPADAICSDLRNAYEAHDHDAFAGHLQRLRVMLAYTGPVAAAHSTAALAQAIHAAWTPALELNKGDTLG